MTAATYQLINKSLLWMLYGWTAVCFLFIMAFFAGFDVPLVQETWDWCERNVFFLSE